MMSLGALLEKHGHEVIPFASANPDNEDSPYAKYFPEPGEPELGRLSRMFYNREAAKKLSMLIEDEQPDLAHMHIYYGKLSASILPAMKKRGLPVVQTLHEYKTICPVYTLYRNGKICSDCQGSKFYKAALHRCNKGSLVRSVASSAEAYISRWIGDVKHVNHFITVSEFQRQMLLQFDVLKPEQITTVHNFLDAEGFAPGYAPGEYFLYFGRLDATKGVKTLIEAVALHPDIPLIIAGRGPQEEELQAIVKDKRLQNVTFAGFKSGEELHKLIRGAISCVIPSEWYETFGLTTIESFALGRPAIGAAIGGITEVISDGKDGLLFESGNVAELSSKLQWMYDRRGDEAPEMGRQGRSKVENEFGIQRHYQKIAAIYDRVMQ